MQPIGHCYEMMLCTRSYCYAYYQLPYHRLFFGTLQAATIACIKVAVIFVEHQFMAQSHFSLESVFAYLITYHTYLYFSLMTTNPNPIPTLLT